MYLAARLATSGHTRREDCRRNTPGEDSEPLEDVPTRFAARACDFPAPGSLVPLARLDPTGSSRLPGHFWMRRSHEVRSAEEVPGEGSEPPEDSRLGSSPLVFRAPARCPRGDLRVRPGTPATPRRCRSPERERRARSARGGLRTLDLRMSQVGARSPAGRPELPRSLIPYECGAMSS